MNKEQILEVIIKNTREVIPELLEHEFKHDDRLADLGANSVDRAEIVAMTIEELSLQISRVELAVAKNIGELAEVIYGKLQSA